VSARPSAAELLRNPDALLTRSDLAELGLTRSMIDAVFRDVARTDGIVVFPGTRRPAIRVRSFDRVVERCTYRDGDVRPT
jgi:hypothetical protein